MGAADRIADTLLRIGEIQGTAANRSAEIQARALEQAAQARAQGVTGSADALARATAANGQIWGQTLTSLGELPNQYLRTAAALKTNALENTMRQQTVDQRTREAAGQKETARLMQGDQLAPGDTGPRQDSYLGDDGLFDVPKLTKALASSGFGDLAPGLVKGAESLNDSITKHQASTQQAAQSQTRMIGDMASGVSKLTAIGMPIDRAIDFVAQPALATKSIDAAQLDQVKQHLVQLPPDQQQAALTALMDRAAHLDKGETLAKGAEQVDRYGRVTSQNVEPEKPKPDYTVNGVRFNGQTNQPYGPAVPTQTAPHAPTEFESFQQAYAQKNGGGAWDALTPDQRLAGIDKFKTLTTDASAVAAADRQAAAIKQQTDQQARTQSFAEAQAGRKEYTDKVSTPYQTALSSAQTLRDVVDAAQQGNNVAGAMQNLEAAMSAIRAQGLNRINTTELGIPASSGSLWQRIQGRVGALVSGGSKSVPADLQKDMKEFADILEKQATLKYQQQRGSLLKTYAGLDVPDESTRPAAVAAPTPVAPAGGVTVTSPGGKTYPFPDQATADRFVADAKSKGLWK